MNDATLDKHISSLVHHITDHTLPSSFPERLLSDRDFMFAAVNRSSFTICFAKGELLDDPELFAIPVRKGYPDALRFASTRLREDDGFMRKMIQESVFALPYASERLRGDAELILSCMKRKRKLVECITPALASDPSFALKAIDLFPGALHYLSPELADDEEIVRAALSKSGLALPFASPRLRNDKRIILAALENGPEVYEYLPEDFKADRDIAFAAVKNSGGTCYAFLPKKFQSDFEFALMADNGGPETRKLIPERFYEDPEFMEYLAMHTPVFALAPIPGKKDVYAVQMTYAQNTEVLPGSITVLPRYVIGIEDWVAPKQIGAFYRILRPCYDKEIGLIFKELPDEVKLHLAARQFRKKIGQRLEEREKAAFREVRLAWKKDGETLEAFAFFSPKAHIKVKLGFGGEYADLPRWSDVTGAKKSLFPAPLCATSEEAKLQLQEMGYVIHGQTVDPADAKENPTVLLEELINNVLSLAKAKGPAFSLTDHYRSRRPSIADEFIPNDILACFLLALEETLSE